MNSTLATTSNSLSVFEAASPPAASIRDLFYLVIVITGLIFLLSEGLIVYCIWRFRRRPETTPGEPPQIYGSNPIEVAWTVAPALVVFVLFLVTVRTVAAIRVSQQPADALQITVIGHQWWWEYEYFETAPSGEKRLLFRTANELHVPQNRAVALELKSADVIHSFWVPRLAGKVDVIPGKTNQMWFQVWEPGVYHGQCAEYCGDQHANMMLRVVVEPQAEFDAWLQGQQQPAKDEPAVLAGRQLFASLACVECHTVRGIKDTGRFGPDLTHLMSRQTLLATTTPNNRDSLHRWVRQPHDLKPGAKMPSFQLGEPQLRDLAAYLESLR
jgi:cytochrome c oxidase subunit 2